MDLSLPLKTAALEKSSHAGYFATGVSVDCVLFGYAEKKLQVLVIESDLEEFRGLYSLPGDLVMPDEDLQHAPARILRERTGLNDLELEQVAAFGACDRHPSGRVITIAYYALVDVQRHQLQLHPHTHWKYLDELHTMAFDHRLILDTCLKELRILAEFRPLLFQLLPPSFSLRTAQEMYEAVYQSAFDRRNFRKKLGLKDWLVDINSMETGVNHRPGKLFRVKKDGK